MSAVVQTTFYYDTPKNIQTHWRIYGTHFLFVRLLCKRKQPTEFIQAQLITFGSIWYGLWKWHAYNKLSYLHLSQFKLYKLSTMNVFGKQRKYIKYMSNVSVRHFLCLIKTFLLQNKIIIAFMWVEHLEIIHVYLWERPQFHILYNEFYTI